MGALIWRKMILLFLSVSIAQGLITVKTLASEFKNQGYSSSAEIPPITHNISAESNPKEGGTITGTGIYNDGSMVTLNAKFTNGFEFLNWSDEDGNIVSLNNYYTFKASENRKFTANFKSASLVVNDMYTITGPKDIPEGFSEFEMPYAAKKGENIVIKYKLKDEYDINGIYVNDIPIKVNENNNTAEFIMPENNIVLTAEAIKISEAKNMYKITVSNPLPEGFESINFPKYTQYKQNVIVGYVLSENYTIENIYTNGIPMIIDNINNSAKFIMPERNIAITAQSIKLLERKRYKINIPEQLPEGFTSLDVKESAENKSNVTISYKLASNYIISGIYANGIPIQLDTKDKSGIFVMPENDVVITAKTLSLSSKGNYKISILNSLPEGFTSLIAPENLRSGDTVVISYKLDEGYTLKGIYANNVLIEIDEENNIGRFVMPQKNVIITAKVVRPESKNGYKITLPFSLPEGFLNLSTQSSAKAGESVFINYKVKDSYNINAIYANGVPITIIPGIKGKFIMPNQDVIITAEASKQGVQNEHKISVKPSEGFISLTAPKYASNNKNVVIGYKLQNGYSLKGIYTSIDTFITFNSETGTFIMPDKDITITAEAVGNEEKGVYKIFVSNFLPDGLISLTVPQEAESEKSVEIKYEVEEGYVLKNMYAEDMLLTLDSENNKAVFNMPFKDVTITAELEKIDN